MIPEFLDGSARTDVHYVDDGAPVAAELTYLLGIDIHQQGDLMSVLCGLGLDIGKIDATAEAAVRIRIKVPCVLR